MPEDTLSHPDNGQRYFRARVRLLLGWPWSFPLSLDMGTNGFERKSPTWPSPAACYRQVDTHSPLSSSKTVSTTESRAGPAVLDPPGLEIGGGSPCFIYTELGERQCGRCPPGLASGVGNCPRPASLVRMKACVWRRIDREQLPVMASPPARSEGPWSPTAATPAAFGIEEWPHSSTDDIPQKARRKLRP